MSQHPFARYLQERMQLALPGVSAQKKMQPVPLSRSFTFPDERKDAHPSSVCILLFEKGPDSEQDLHVVLTLRTESIRHAGQISFPGGRADNGESPPETAIRETEEEIGVPGEAIHLVGTITPLYLYRSNNKITPFVAFLDEEPRLNPNPDEVEEAFTVSLKDLLNEQNMIREKWELSHATFMVPYWNIHSTPLWGATAMMMSELLELYKEFLTEEK